MKTRHQKHFRLPEIETGTIEEAIAQLDLATSHFAIHKDIQIATEVSIASRRYVIAMEKTQKKEKLDLTTIERFFQDVIAVREQFDRMRKNYQNKLNDRKRRTLENIKGIQRNYSVLGYYLTLLRDQVQRIQRLTIPENDNY